MVSTGVKIEDTNKDIEQLEIDELTKSLSDFKSDLPALTAERGLDLAQQLFASLSQEKDESQTKKIYEEEIVQCGKEIIDIGLES